MKGVLSNYLEVLLRQLQCNVGPYSMDNKSRFRNRVKNRMYVTFIIYKVRLPVNCVSN